MISGGSAGGGSVFGAFSPVTAASSLSPGGGVLSIATAAPAGVRPSALGSDDFASTTVGCSGAGASPRRTARASSTPSNASVGAFNDPIDVIPIRLRKGDRFSATLGSTVKKGFTLGLFNPSARGFELDSSKQPHLERSGSNRLSLRRVKRSGIWFVAVLAPNSPTTDVRYALSLQARRP